MNKILIEDLCKALAKKALSNNGGVNSLINGIAYDIELFQPETNEEVLLISLKLELLAHKLIEDWRKK